jgi:hypothetical protein
MIQSCHVIGLFEGMLERGVDPHRNPIPFDWHA